MILGQGEIDEGVFDRIVTLILTAEDAQAGALIAELNADQRRDLDARLAASGIDPLATAPAFAVAKKLEKAGVPVTLLIGGAVVLGALAIGTFVYFNR
jgi:hypothetical protein